MAITSLPKLNFSIPFAPTSAFPLNYNQVFDSLVEAQNAAKTAEEIGSSNTIYYYGMEIMVITPTEATLYVIQPDKTLKPVGTVPVGDNKSIEINQDHQITVKGFEAATTNMQPRKNAAGEIEWFTPDTSTVEGLSTTVGQHTQQIGTLETDVAGLKTDKADKATTYTKQETDTQIDTKIAAAVSSTYKAAGSIAFENLPAPAKGELGKVYNVTNEFTADTNFVAGETGKKFPAGTNIVCIEEGSGTYKWDVLSGFIDLSSYETADKIAQIYATKVEMNTGLETKVDKVVGSRLMTDAEGTKLEGIEAGAQVNKIEGANADEFTIGVDKVLAVKAIAMDKVTGLQAALDGKVNAEAGKSLMTDAERTKLNGIQDKAQVNILESVKVAGVALPIADKAVDIVIATAQAAGVVKGSDAENKVAVATDGTMEINSVNVAKLTQTAGDTLTLNGGNAAGNQA